MRKLFIAATHEACDAFCAERTVVDFECADFTTVSAAVMTAVTDTAAMSTACHHGMIRMTLSVEASPFIAEL